MLSTKIDQVAMTPNQRVADFALQHGGEPASGARLRRNNEIHLHLGLQPKIFSYPFIRPFIGIITQCIAG